MPYGFWRPTVFLWRSAKGTRVDSSSEEVLRALKSPLISNGAPSPEVLKRNFDCNFTLFTMPIYATTCHASLLHCPSLGISPFSPGQFKQLPNWSSCFLFPLSSPSRIKMCSSHFPKSLMTFKLDTKTLTPQPNVQGHFSCSRHTGCTCHNAWLEVPRSWHPFSWHSIFPHVVLSTWRTTTSYPLHLQNCSSFKDFPPQSPLEFSPATLSQTNSPFSVKIFVCLSVVTWL